MNAPAPEFSRIIMADHVGKGVEQELEAKPAERAALAKRFDLVDLKKLKAQLSLTPGRDQTVTVTGKAMASVVQSCVVTLEPVSAHLEIKIDVTFIPAAQNKLGAGSPDADDLDEEFETFTGGRIDLGEMLAQQLGINLDPYPRKPGVALGSVEFGTKAETRRPFAELAALAKTPPQGKKS